MIDPQIIHQGIQQGHHSNHWAMQNVMDMTSRLALKRKLQNSDNVQLNNLAENKNFRQFLKNAPINQYGVNNSYNSLSNMIGQQVNFPNRGSLMGLMFGYEQKPYNQFNK